MSPKPSQTQASDSDSEGELKRQQAALIQRCREEEERLRKEQEELEAKVAERKRKREEKKRLAEEAKRKAEEVARLAKEEAEQIQREKEELKKAEQVEKERLEREAAYKAKVEAGKKAKAAGAKRKVAEVTREGGPVPKKTKTATAKAGKGDIPPKPKQAAREQWQATPGPSHQDRVIEGDRSSSEVDEWMPGTDQDSVAGVVAGPRTVPTRREKGKGVEKEKINKYACESCNQAKQKCVIPTDADVPEHEMMSLLLAESCMSRMATISLLNEVRGLRANIAKRQAETARTLKGLNKAVGDFVEEFQEFYDRTVKTGHLLDDDAFELVQGKKSEKRGQWG